MTFRKSITAFLFVISIGLLSSCGLNDSDPQPDTLDLAPVNDMLVTLTTRTGSTKPAYSENLSSAAETSAAAFKDSLSDMAALRRFIDALPPVLQTFEAGYSDAVQIGDVDAKAAAADRLFRDLLQCADQSGISQEDFEMAILSAFSDLQPKLSLPPFSTEFSDADRELVNLLMIATVNQLHERVVLNSGSAAITTLEVDTVLSGHFFETITVMDASLMANLRSVEQGIVDSLDDTALLRTAQFNQEAINDLFFLKYALEIYSGLSTTTEDIVLTRIIGRMNDVGGSMSDVTVTTLVEAGIARNTQPFLSLKEYFVYDWVRPEMSLSYTPDPELVSALSGTVPSAPDFSPFLDPYRAVFELNYDLYLCSLLEAEEWNQAIGDIPEPLSMQVRLALRKSQSDRRKQVLMQFKGATASESKAIAQILMFQR